MLAMINIKIDSAIESKERFDNIVNIESIRDFILSVCDKEPAQVKDILNYKSHAMPKIIYSRPHKNSIRIFSLGEEGRIALNSIYANILRVGHIKIKDKKYAISGLPRLEIDLPYLPMCNGNIHTYTTLTPLMVFNKHNQRIFQAILGKHFGTGYINDGTQEQQVAFYKELTEYVNLQIKDSIKYSLSSLIPSKKKEDFKFVENIQIDWDDISVIHAHYHTEEKTLPMIVGKFKTNFTIPKFVGYKIGKGFGEMSLKCSDKESLCS